ncbi:histone acetylation protein-domain-containing protein [Apiospora marii]|uniref:histone acetyltransferase n=1 Tax=Apiospora marii TaxID=335849 RepID=A0ABR1R5G5_9PEZI
MANPTETTGGSKASSASSPNPKNNALVEQLAQVLPEHAKFAIHHLSTPPTLTEPLNHPPALPTDTKNGADSVDVRPRKPLKTYCEKHFLAVSIEHPEFKEQLLALALEVYIYTTSFSTLIFVSKADSTGYLNLLKLPQGTPSPIREVTTTFVSYLVSQRRRKHIQFIINLFARAQSQYLFPGSINNGGKHVLDDRGLVRWWCRVLNPLLEPSSENNTEWEQIHGYLIVPGLEPYDTRLLLPRTQKAKDNWSLSDPLERISPYASDPATYGKNIPPRCLIPMYPDDPKARFVDELEETTPLKQKLTRGWPTPKTLDQFWELMSHRQECSSGRLTGFIWLVLDPPSRPSSSATNQSQTQSDAQSDSTAAAAAATLKHSETDSKATREKKQKKKKVVLKGPIVPRQPRIKTHQRVHFPKHTSTAHYYWPEEGRGQVILDDSGYKRAVELLLHLEFGTAKQALASTARWINEVNVGERWSLDIVGRRSNPMIPEASGDGTMGSAVNNLSGMIKRKRPTDGEEASSCPGEAAPVNTLGSGLVRKKPKTADSQQPPLPTPASSSNGTQVNVLGAGLVRKKQKS